MQINEQDVVQWLHQQREERGLRALEFTVYSGQPQSGTMPAIPPFHFIYAAGEQGCRQAKTITEATEALTRAQ